MATRTGEGAEIHVVMIDLALKLTHNSLLKIERIYQQLLGRVTNRKSDL